MQTTPEEERSASTVQEASQQLLGESASGWYSCLLTGRGLFKPVGQATGQYVGLHLNPQMEIAGERMDTEIGFLFLRKGYTTEQGGFLETLLQEDTIRGRQYILALAQLGPLWYERVQEITQIQKELTRARQFLNAAPFLHGSQRVYRPTFPPHGQAHPYLKQRFPIDLRDASQRELALKSSRIEANLARKQACIETLLPTITEIVEPWVPQNP